MSYNNNNEDFYYNQDQGYYHNDLSSFTAPEDPQITQSTPKSEIFKSLQSMGYNYFLIEKAYEKSLHKSTEGVLAYITDNPRLEREVESELQEQEAMLYSQTENQKKEEEIIKESFENEAFKRPPNVGYIDPKLRETLLFMGYEDYMIVAALQATNSVSADAAVAWILDYGFKIPKPNSPLRNQKKEESFIEKKQPYKAGDNNMNKNYRNTNNSNKDFIEKKIEKKVLKSNAYHPGYNRSIPSPTPVISNYQGSNPKSNGRIPINSSIHNKKDNHIESTPIEEKTTPKVDENEARRQAMLLQAKARERMNKREEKTQNSEEIKKIEDPKLAQEAKRKQEEEALRRNLERIEEEKKNKDKEKIEILKQLAIDKARRAGRDPAEVEEMFKSEETIEDKFLKIFEKMATIYSLEGVEGEKLKTCLTTCMIYFSKYLFFFEVCLSVIFF